ncbi:hypothetical protein [Aphanothece hegewaldii]|uniref:hypothetical protein n=1 Tax=Aphanothece hegewaldii TaxID=1521625 RepID=UPI0015E6FC30|nr:hypothetical protein [Aphanothece hegewaldii]
MENAILLLFQQQDNSNTMIALEELANEFIDRPEFVKRSKEVYNSLLKPLRE